MIALGLALALAAAPVAAQTVSDLVDYFQGLSAFQARFEQLQKDARSGRTRFSSGEVWLSRPGRFRWENEQPYEQVVVSNGELLWQYDADLEQVTVSPLDQVLDATPLNLISGRAPLDEGFIIDRTEGPPGEIWYRLTPRQAAQDSVEDQVQTLRLGLADGRLVGLELRDSLGQRTRVQFHRVRQNRPLPEALFDFHPPAGVDVIGP